MKIGDKVVVWTDLHLGLRNNERRHNDECEQFVKWMIKEAHDFGANVSIFMGDFHHYRNTVQCSTLNYSISILELLNNNFNKHYQILGNHDLFYKGKREINSVEFGRNLPNIEIVNKITTLGDITLVPWLIESEHKKMENIASPYVFGHFEFPFFLMNALVAMPDTGKINADAFKMQNQRVFSGHFHKRQKQYNLYGASIEYIGNCFPHNFSDAWDDDRGIMLLELGKEPIYKAWPNAPKYRTLNLSQLIESPELYIDDKTNAKITVDIDISFEEANFIRDTLISKYNPRELSLIPFKQDLGQDSFDESISFESVDQIVSKCLSSIESTTIDKNLLIEIYSDI